MSAAAEALAAPDLWAAPELPFLPSGEGAALLAAYIDMLLVWNRKLNLAGCHEPVPLLATLIQDSFFLTQFLERIFPAPPGLTLDPGAGAGLPGIPLRIFWRKGEYRMIERSQKRALFLANACSRLKLENTSSCCQDAKAVFAASQKADCILSRAFMPWQELLAFCRPGLAPGGTVVIMANQPPPGALPPGWLLQDSFGYRLPERERWFWAIRAHS